MSVIVKKIKLKISNCYLIQGESNILVDTGSPNEGKQIISALEKEGLKLNQISLIFHTHGHGDHCGSTRQLLELCKIPTAIHSQDAHMVKRGRNDFLKITRAFARIIKPFVDLPFPSFIPDILLDNYTELNNFGIKGQIYLTPGHTPGSISLALDNNEAIIGDIMMGGYFGGLLFADRPDYHYFADDINSINQSINKVLQFDANTYYVGHGGPLSKNSIQRRFTNYLNP